VARRARKITPAGERAAKLVELFLAELAALGRLWLFEKNLQRVDKIPGEVWFKLDRRHGDDVPPLLCPALPGLGYFLLAGDVLDVDNLAHRRQVEGIDDLVYHVSRGAEDKQALGFDRLDALADLGGVVGLHENGPFDGAYLAGFFLGRTAGDNFAVLDKQTVVDNAVDILVVGDNQRAVAFSGPARSY
jgi:hypothetical protein